MDFDADDFDSTKYMKEREKEVSKCKITKPEDIANLPWAGNAMSDMPLFDLIYTYVLNEKDKEKQKKALNMMSVHGMGEPEAPISDEELEEELQLMKDHPPERP